MDITKTILGLAGGLLVGLSLTGHDVVGVVGLPFDQQMFVGLLVFTIAIVVHVLGGGRAWPFTRKH